MGCGASKPAIPAASKAEQQKCQTLEQALSKAREAERKKFKILLLGTGESGKSTILKQMVVLFDAGGFSQHELATYRHVVRRNVVECMQVLVDGAERFGFRLGEESRAAAALVREVDTLDTRFWRRDLVDAVTLLWGGGEEAIASAYAQRSRLQLLDSAAYLFDNVARFGEQDYTPTQEDVLRARLRTSGIVEKSFLVRDSDGGDPVPFVFIDVGGQRNERRKWIHCFEGVTAVIFVASLSEFDQQLYEDESTNRMHESLNVFEAICSNCYFHDSVIILFLNKTDLFAAKLAEGASVRAAFPEYAGADTFEEASAFIEQRYVALADGMRTPGSVFVHFTCATDTENVERVFSFCRSFLLQRSLSQYGLM